METPANPSPPSRNGQLFIIFSCCCLLPVIATFLLLAFWVFDQRLPMADISGRVVGRDRVDPQIVYVERTGTKLRPCDGSSHRWLVDKRGFLLELRDDHIPYPEDPTGKSEKWIFRVEIPAAMQGPLTYKTIFYFSCNPAQRMFPIAVKVPDIHFDFPQEDVWPKEGALMPQDLREWP